MAEVRDKEECYRLYSAGLFANKARSWNSYEEVMQNGFNGNISIRGKGIPRIDARYNIPLSRLRQEIDGLVAKGYPESVFRFNESMPDEVLIVQGEVMVSLGGLVLTYSTLKLPMNDALRERTLHAKGLTAKMILIGAMDGFSFQNLEELFEVYPDSVIEFSAYGIDVGVIPHRNTVFWEVRNY